MTLDIATCLPVDWTKASLVGRVWLPAVEGPSVVKVTEAGVFDITKAAPTVSDLCNDADPLKRFRAATGPSLGSVAEILANSEAGSIDAKKPSFLAPIDLQAVKASGVTFVSSMLERLVEEQAKGDPTKGDAIRAEIQREIGTSLKALKPGSEEAMRLKELLIKKGRWSQYLEVGIGPDAEIFTKCPPMASVGVGAEIGMVVSAAGRIVGASLGNDVNLRDVEGRSGLLLGKAKDQNASSAIGPFVRLFDEGYTLDDLRNTVVELRVDGPDQFVMKGASSVAEISRDLTDLVGQLLNPNHQYPDGVCLYSGTMFAPTQDRSKPGLGFTHEFGDIVTIRAERLGALVNRVAPTDRAPPWTFGTSALMRNLAKRGLLG